MARPRKPKLTYFYRLWRPDGTPGPWVKTNETLYNTMTDPAWEKYIKEN